MQAGTGFQRAYIIVNMTSQIVNRGSERAVSGIDALIARRVRALRLARGMSMGSLVHACGVSKAMISRVERGASSPTAALLGRVASGLGVSISELLVEPDARGDRLRRRATQEVWRDPRTGYRRRQVAPRHPTSGVELVEVQLPRATRVSYAPWKRRAYSQHAVVLEGRLRITYGDETFSLEAGDCLDFGVDRRVTYHAGADRACRYLLVLRCA
jgi:transcriptional regulator with XRE-family HTH domain